jgi:integrase
VLQTARSIAVPGDRKGAERAQKWVLTLRAAIKQEHGFGWSVRDKGAKVQLTHRYEDGTRSSITLDCPWNPEAISEVLGLLPEIRSRMESQRLGLAEAYALLRGPDRSRAERLDWHLLVTRFQKHKVADTGAVKPRTWDAMYGPVMGQVLEAMAARPVPRDGRALLASLRDRCGGEPGSRGRQLRMQYTSQLLRYVVNELGAPERWLPPHDLKPFVGQATQDVARQGATPIKDPQLLRILQGIPDPRWRLAVGLMACFGLRPVELGYVRVNGDKLHVAYRKRTARGTTKPGDVVGLDPEGLQGESLRLLRLLESGLIELPPLGLTDGDVAQSVRTYLTRRQVWQSLKAEVSAQGGKLSAYSFRHGYALRGHELYELSPRVTAALMRHSLQTHHAHYGAWVDDEVVDASVQRGIQRLAKELAATAI